MAQIRCGKLIDMAGRNGVKFRGRVTLEGRLDDVIVLREHPRARPGEKDSTAPAFEVFLEKNGRESAHGAAWLKNSEKVKGGDFISMTLDRPAWPRALNLTAFPPDSETSKEWTVTWSRPRGSRVQDEEFESLAQEN